MKTKFFVLFLIAGFAGLVTGCVNTVDGRQQAGVPFVKDKLESRYERTVPQVLEAAKYVLNFNGKLTAENTINNTLQGQVNQVTVWVRADEIDASKPVTQVTVQTRTKARNPDLDLAHEIEKQIAIYLAAH